MQRLRHPTHRVFGYLAGNGLALKPHATAAAVTVGVRFIRLINEGLAAMPRYNPEAIRTQSFRTN